MHESEKIAAAVRELRSRGVWAYSAAPPAFRAFWLVGWHLPPPYFMTFAQLMLVAGSVFAVLWPLCIWLVRGGTFGRPLGAMVVQAALGGVFFGLFMAIYCRVRARQLQLPPWSEYAPKDAA